MKTYRKTNRNKVQNSLESSEILNRNLRRREEGGNLAGFVKGNEQLLRAT